MNTTLIWTYERRSYPSWRSRSPQSEHCLDTRSYHGDLETTDRQPCDANKRFMLTAGLVGGRRELYLCLLPAVPGTYSRAKQVLGDLLGSCQLIAICSPTTSTMLLKKGPHGESVDRLLLLIAYFGLARELWHPQESGSCKLFLHHIATLLVREGRSLREG